MQEVAWALMGYQLPVFAACLLLLPGNFMLPRPSGASWVYVPLEITYLMSNPKGASGARKLRSHPSNPFRTPASYSITEIMLDP